MPTRVERRTVDLSGYPDLVVIYLGMRVNRIAGIKTLLGFGPKISSSAAAHPDGSLLHENFVFSFFPMHARHAPILARPRLADEMDAIGSPPGMVAELFEGFRRDRFLARNLSAPGRHGSYLRRYRSKNRIHELRTRDARAWPDVRRRFACWDEGCRTAGSVRKGPVRTSGRQTSELKFSSHLFAAGSALSSHVNPNAKQYQHSGPSHNF